MFSKLIILLLKLLDGSTLIAFCLSKMGRIICAASLGLIGTLGYAPYELWPALLGSLTLLFILLSGLKSAKAVFATVLTYFIGLNLASLSWLNFVMEGFGGMPSWAAWAVTVLFALYLALHYALFAALAKHFSKYRQAVFIFYFLPASFAAADFTVGQFLSGFPWMYFGNTALQGPFASFLPLIGVRGTSVLMTFTAAAVAMAALRRYLYLPAAGLVVFTGIMLTDVNYTQSTSEHDVALVQGNLEQNVRLGPDAFQKSLAVYWEASRNLIPKHSLVVWPEAALPFYINDAMDVISDLDSAARAYDSNLVTGILRRDENGRYNSIAVLGKRDKNEVQIYDKRHLVPFGEFVPFESLLRPLGKIFNIPMSDFTTPVHAPLPLKIQGVTYIPAICYEAIFPELILSLDSSEAGAILMLSNDGWFGNTRGPLQHFNIARARTLELQKPMLRITNNGVSALIAPDGTVKKMLPRDKEAVLETKFTQRKGQTPYSRIGSWGAFLIMLMLVTGGFINSRMKTNEKAERFKELVRP